VTEPESSEAWLSYLMPCTDTLRTLPGFYDPVAVALFERITSADAETTLRRDSGRPRTFDLDHMRDIHGRLFGDVYEWAGRLRDVDIGKPGQTAEPFLHHPWIQTYTAAVVDQLRTDDNLAGLGDPGVWADRAAHVWHAMLHAHPFREGNGRSARIWIEDLAAAAGHTLDWDRSSAERNVLVAVAAAHGDLEPMRALLTQVAGGTLGVDRPVDALDDLHKLQHDYAWGRTGLAFGTDADRERLGPQSVELVERIDIVRYHLDGLPERATTREQPPKQRWRGLAASINPALTQVDDWPQFAAELDAGAVTGVDVAADLHRLTKDVGARMASSAPPTSSPATPPAARRLPGPAPTPSPPARELAAAGYYRQPPPPPGSRR
jgi:cell filamentation protein